MLSPRPSNALRRAPADFGHTDDLQSQVPFHRQTLFRDMSFEIDSVRNVREAGTGLRHRPRECVHGMPVTREMRVPISIRYPNVRRTPESRISA